VIEQKKPELVILAAGMGSRYGGIKQLESVGPSGETIMEYSIFDAIRAGFGRVIFVIKEEHESLIQEQIIQKYQDLIEFSWVFQKKEDLPSAFQCPASRSKPWGTGQAILAAKEQVQAPFAVINADDFYGPNAFIKMAEQLRQLPPEGNEFCLMGYRLSNTLSQHGSVNRGLCETEGGYLTGLQEITSIQKKEDRFTYTASAKAADLSDSSVVSMNFWGFTPAVFSLLQQHFEDFLTHHLEEPTAEFYITAPIDFALDQKTITIRVLTTEEQWLGVTYAEDKTYVVQGILNAITSGTYPPQLFP